MVNPAFDIPKKRSIVYTFAQRGVFILQTLFIMKKITNYFRDTFAEMKHVKWPSQNQALIYTALIVAICAFTAVFLGLFDFAFSRGIDMIVNQF